MRLFEIYKHLNVSSARSVKKKIGRSDSIDDDPQSKPEDFFPVKRRPLGEPGVQGMAWEHGPGSVIKQTRLSGPDDNYLVFINTIKEYQDNPFFPKIYGTKILKAPLKHLEGKSQYILIVKMEKLIPLNSLKLYDIIPYLYKQLGFKLTNTDKEAIKGIKDRDPSIERKILHQKLRDLFRGREEFKNFKSLNPQFLEAVKILQPMIRQLGDDLHTGNVMVRLTSIGPQLVITDPLAWSGFSFGVSGYS